MIKRPFTHRLLVVEVFSSHALLIVSTMTQLLCLSLLMRQPHARFATAGCDRCCWLLFYGSDKGRSVGERPAREHFLRHLCQSSSPTIRSSAISAGCGTPLPVRKASGSEPLAAGCELPLAAGCELTSCRNPCAPDSASLLSRLYKMAVSSLRSIIACSILRLHSSV